MSVAFWAAMPRCLSRSSGLSVMRPVRCRTLVREQICAGVMLEHSLTCAYSVQLAMALSPRWFRVAKYMSFGLPSVARRPSRRSFVPREFGLVQLELLGHSPGDAGTYAQPLVIGFHGRPF